MPRIPVIEQSTSVSTATPTTQAQGMQVVSPLGNAPAVAAQGLDELAHAEVLNQNALFHKENADAIANTGKPLSDADVYWKDYLTKAPSQMQDGGLVDKGDGTMVGFRAKAEEDFDKWSSGFLGGITNEKAKIYAQNHINALRTQTLDHAITLEATSAIANRSAKVDEAVTAWAGSVAKDDSDISQKILAAKTLIANSGFDEQTRNAKARAAVNQIVESAIMGNIERNPGATRAALIARYGVDPTAPPPKPQQPNPQIAGGIPAGVAPGVAKFTDTILQQATAKGVDPAIMAWQLDKESKGNPNAQNNNDIAVTGSPSIGIAQFQPGTAKRYNIDPRDPVQSIQGQAAYMSDLLKRYGGDYQKALAGYNWGEGNVDKAIKKYGDTWFQHAPASTRDYVTTIQTNASKSAPGTGSGRGSVNPDTVTPAPIEPAPPPPAAFSPQLASLVDQLSPEKLPAYISHATTQVNQQQALLRSQIATTEGDHLAAFMNGQDVAKPLTQDDYTRAYGAVEGPQRFANYQSVQQLGQDITSLKAMPPAQMANMAERYRPTDPGAPGYDLATKRYDTMLKAIDQVNKSRQDDPMGYAMQSGIGGAKPLNFQDQKAFTGEIAKRAGIAQTMQQTYGAPYSLLTKAEATTLHQGFDGMTTQQKLGYLTSIKTALPDPVAYRSIMQAVAPDSPVTAMAGIILSKQQPAVQHNTFSADTVLRQQDVAGVMLEGESLINPTKTAKGEDGKGKVFSMPKEQDMRDQFNNVVGQAFAGDPRGADFAYQAVKAYYAGRSARIGDISGNINSGTMKEAINAVIGGVSDGGTGKADVVRPWGMDDGQFKNAVQSSFTAAMAANGYTGTQADKLRNYSLQSAGDGKYLLQSGNGYLVGQDNRPVVLDLNALPATPPQNRISPREVSGSVTMAPMAAPATVVPEKTVKPVTQQPKTK
jgi:hypothetical protein